MWKQSECAESVGIGRLLDMFVLSLFIYLIINQRHTLRPLNKGIHYMRKIRNESKIESL